MADNRLAEWIHDTDLASQMKEYTKQFLTRNEILVYLRSGVIYKYCNKRGFRCNVRKCVWSSWSHTHIFKRWRHDKLVKFWYNIPNIYKDLNSHVALRKFIIAIPYKTLEEKSVHYEKQD